jgi:hypothetical protein
MREDCECGHGQHDMHHWGYMDKKMMMKFVVKAAKFELLKEKVTKQLEASEGKKLDELAKVLVSAETDFKKGKIEMFRKNQEAMDKIREAMGWEEE